MTDPDLAWRLRPATVDDAEACARVHRAARIALGFLPSLHTAEEDVAFIRDRVIPVSTVMVAEDASGEVIAMAAWREGWLDHLYVMPGHQSRGIGRSLLNEAKRALPAGFSLWTFEQNERARRFYEREGCVAAERTDGSGNEERLPDVRYEWKPA